MPNPLYMDFGQQTTQNNDFSQFINELNNFKRSFHGDAKAQVQMLLQNGSMSQADFNRYAQIANQIIQQMPK